MTPARLPEILAASRLFALRAAVVAQLKALVPDVEIKSHPGKIDMSDVIEQDVFATPSIVIALTHFRPDSRLSDAPDLVAKFVAYVVVENMTIDGKLVYADEIGPAVCDAIACFLARATPDTQWGLTDIGTPEDVEAQPVFTAKSFAKGVCFYAVSWKQTLYACGEPLFGGGDDV
ncbi:MAG: hypothetical protein QM651_18105 [Rhodoblastus sp.]